MSSSNMMYNYWLNKKNKKYRMARTYYGDAPAHPEDPIPDLNNNTDDYSIYEPSWHNTMAAGLGIPHDLPLNTGNRLVGRNNHIVFVVSPRTWHDNQLHNIAVPGDPVNNRYLTHRQHDLIWKASRELPHDYPENFFEHKENPEIMHIYSTNDDENNPDFPKVLPGFVHYMQHRPQPYGAGATPTEEERQALRSFIIRGLANKAAHIIHGQHPGGPNSDFSPAADYFEEFEDHMPDWIKNAPDLMSYEHKPIGILANTLDKLHHEFDALPLDQIRDKELPDYILNKANTENNQHYKNYLRLIASGLRPRK